MKSDSSHGWVVPRADGARAKCGGPALCATCKTEQMHETMLAGVFGQRADRPSAEERSMPTEQDNHRRPAGPAEAEALAGRFVGEYLTACRMTDRDQMGDYLMKLTSIAAVLMAQAEGSANAGERLAGTAAWVRKTMPAAPARLELVQ
ncbi:hypothetical protein [Achromobacter sp. UBA4530]|uniref:hypothetical protein n=1 Tax=Achromobacter sp. UBA4530 TaxID=1945912 RepID=UPI002579E5FD|nr:hypothetical protein [Achromobacter sp. UBA4530]